MPKCCVSELERRVISGQRDQGKKSWLYLKGEISGGRHARPGRDKGVIPHTNSAQSSGLGEFLILIPSFTSCSPGASH